SQQKNSSAMAAASRAKAQGRLEAKGSGAQTSNASNRANSGRSIGADCARSPPMADGPWAPSPFATSDGRRMLDWRTDMGAPLLAPADIVVIVLDRGRHGTTACRATVGTGVTTLGECLAGVVAL